jgi:hypothetical protein
LDEVYRFNQFIHLSVAFLWVAVAMKVTTMVGQIPHGPDETARRRRWTRARRSVVMGEMPVATLMLVAGLALGGLRPEVFLHLYFVLKLVCVLAIYLLLVLASARTKAMGDALGEAHHARLQNLVRTHQLIRSVMAAILLVVSFLVTHRLGAAVAA